VDPGPGGPKTPLKQENSRFEKLRVLSREQEAFPEFFSVFKKINIKNSLF
jgi:hypothetical protein